MRMVCTGRTPDYVSFHASVTNELFSIKNRVRNLVKHWATDGESKEVALRSVLRRHLPSVANVGRGFIVAKDDSSTQIDVLVTDSSKPTLFQEGDLMIVTPDAVLGVIEVKTRQSTQKDLIDTLTKLSLIEDMCCQATRRDSVWTGLFIYEGAEHQQEMLLRGLGEAFRETNRPVNCVSCGKDVFIRHWSRGEDVDSPEPGPVWHSYLLSDVAPSYFMGNLIDSISSIDHSSASFAWFPVPKGKESNRKLYLPQSQTVPRPF